MLKVTIGAGVSVRVVNDDTVMPLKLGGFPSSVAGAVEVATTTEWGIVRMSVRRWEERGGSFEELRSGRATWVFDCVGEVEYWRL
jgi:hypothetical protein